MKRNVKDGPGSVLHYNIAGLPGTQTATLDTATYSTKTKHAMSLYRVGRAGCDNVRYARNRRWNQN